MYGWQKVSMAKLLFIMKGRLPLTLLPLVRTTMLWLAHAGTLAEHGRKKVSMENPWDFMGRLW